jgi:SAM-dependent methyltransferase
MTSVSAPPLAACAICNCRIDSEEPRNFGRMRGNTARFQQQQFTLWKCPGCHTISCVDRVDLRDIYRDYPLNRRRLDIFALGIMRNLLRRLTLAGLKKTDAILDYGCGNGVFLRYLARAGYRNVAGYDPYVPEYAELPHGKTFDCVINNDVIEHVENPRAVLQSCAGILKPGGLLYIGTADSEPVDMRDLEPHVMRLHQPFHRLIFTERTLHSLCLETELEFVTSYRRSYMDTLVPFANYRFLDELNKAIGHNLDVALDPAVARIVARTPRLWFYAFFGYFFPSAEEPAVILRKQPETRSMNSRKA